MAASLSILVCNVFGAGASSVLSRLCSGYWKPLESFQTASIQLLIPSHNPLPWPADPPLQPPVQRQLVTLRARASCPESAIFLRAGVPALAALWEARLGSRVPLQYLSR